MKDLIFTVLLGSIAIKSSQSKTHADHFIRTTQYGITCTPRELMDMQFSKGEIIKGNVGKFWQYIVLMF